MVDFGLKYSTRLHYFCTSICFCVTKDDLSYVLRARTNALKNSSSYSATLAADNNLTDRWAFANTVKLNNGNIFKTEAHRYGTVTFAG